ncbi:MAG: nucleoside transporter C-terminal domain-containing protein, partial [Phycisphaerales bacterium]
AMLVAFVALIAMLNWPLSALGELGPIARWRAENGIPPFSLQMLLGVVFRPIAWLMGIPSADVGTAGTLLGTQIIATEFMAYIGLSKHVAEHTISSRGAQVLTYGLCGFANLPSIAIQIGGLSAMAPERRADLAKLAPKAMVAGALSCWMTACVAGLFID